MKKTMQVLGQLLLCSSLIFLCENVQSQLDISVSSTPVLCNGDLSEVTISVSGGTAPYSGIGTVSSSDVTLIITGVIDGPLSGGVPKAVESVPPHRHDDLRKNNLEHTLKKVALNTSRVGKIMYCELLLTSLGPEGHTIFCPSTELQINYYTPLRTPRISELKSQILKPPFFS